MEEVGENVGADVVDNVIRKQIKIIINTVETILDKSLLNRKNDKIEE